MTSSVSRTTISAHRGKVSRYLGIRKAARVVAKSLKIIMDGTGSHGHAECWEVWKLKCLQHQTAAPGELFKFSPNGSGNVEAHATSSRIRLTTSTPGGLKVVSERLEHGTSQLRPTSMGTLYPRRGIALRPFFGPPHAGVFRLRRNGGLAAPSRLSNVIGGLCRSPHVGVLRCSIYPNPPICSGIVKGQEPVRVQTLRPEASVECFDEGIVGGRSPA